jgi:hypothetical protein
LTRAPNGKPTTWRAAACGLLLFAFADAAVFRSGLYLWVAKPDSNAGWVAMRTRLEPTFRPVPKEPSVLLLGDSRMGEACSPGGLRELVGAPPIEVRNASIPGSTPRVWPYVFRSLASQPARWTILVVGLSTFDDDAEPEALTERALDLAFLGPLLGIGDAAELAASFPPGSVRKDTWLCALCKSYAWRRDLRDLLAEPRQRYHDLRRQLGQLRWGAPYEGRDGDLAGIRVEEQRVVGLGADRAGLADALRLLVFPPPAAPGNVAYRRQWLGRLADATAAAGTRLVFLRMPTQVLPRAAPHPPREDVLDELRRRPHVEVLDRELFAGLERPEFFYDSLHLNRAGRVRFTRMLADALLRRCGGLLGR